MHFGRLWITINTDRRNSNGESQLMSLYGIFSSPSQRRLFLLTSVLIVFGFVSIIWLVNNWSPDTRGWNLFLDLLVALVSSAIFVIIAALYIRHFFSDPYQISLANKLLPQDIGQALSEMAESALEYKLFVRTGRHFRSEVLPILITKATTLRRPVAIEAVLLDFRNDDVCNKYASYRKSSSFDHHQWSKKYVQIEILATILKLIRAADDHPAFIKVNLYLSSRLSTFRFDGSQDQIIVTREDPKDVASRYRHSDNDLSAYLNEFNWVRDEACKVDVPVVSDAPTTVLRAMFDNCAMIPESEKAIIEATKKPSPYVR